MCQPSLSATFCTKSLLYPDTVMWSHLIQTETTAVLLTVTRGVLSQSVPVHLPCDNWAVKVLPEIHSGCDSKSQQRDHLHAGQQSHLVHTLHVQFFRTPLNQKLWSEPAYHLRDQNLELQSMFDARQNHVLSHLYQYVWICSSSLLSATSLILRKNYTSV